MPPFSKRCSRSPVWAIVVYALIRCVASTLACAIVPASISVCIFRIEVKVAMAYNIDRLMTECMQIARHSVSSATFYCLKRFLVELQCHHGNCHIVHYRYAYW